MTVTIRDLYAVNELHRNGEINDEQYNTIYQLYNLKNNNTLALDKIIKKLTIHEKNVINLITKAHFHVRDTEFLLPVIDKIIKNTTNTPKKQDKNLIANNIKEEAEKNLPKSRAFVVLKTQSGAGGALTIKNVNSSVVDYLNSLSHKSSSINALIIMGMSISAETINALRRFEDTFLSFGGYGLRAFDYTYTKVDSSGNETGEDRIIDNRRAAEKELSKIKLYLKNNVKCQFTYAAFDEMLLLNIGASMTAQETIIHIGRQANRAGRTEREYLQDGAYKIMQTGNLLAEYYGKKNL